MNPRFYVKINPNFKFKKISLNNQSRLGSKTNLKNILYNFDDYLSVKMNNKETNKNNNIKDKLLEKDLNKYKNEFKGFINNKFEKSLSPIKLEKKNTDVHSLRTKLLQNNNKLQRIDFNINIIGSNKEKNDLKLKVEHCLSQIKINSNISRNSEGIKKISNYRSEETKNDFNQNPLYKLRNSKINKSHLFIKSDRLYLPSISYNVVRKSNKIKALMKKIQKNIYNYDQEKTINKDKLADNGKKYERSLLNNINYFNDNKSLTIKINEIKRNSDIFKYINDNDKDFISNSINKKENENNQETDINNKELFQRKEDDKYMIYESAKKYIDTDKIYNYNKFRLANIPNVSIDKGLKNIKTLESNIINIKKENLDIPICINRHISKII